MSDLLSGFQSDEFVPAEYDASFEDREEMARDSDPRELPEMYDREYEEQELARREAEAELAADRILEQQELEDFESIGFEWDYIDDMYDGDYDY